MKQLNVKDLITVGIFTAIYLVVFCYFYARLYTVFNSIFRINLSNRLWYTVYFICDEN